MQDRPARTTARRATRARPMPRLELHPFGPDVPRRRRRACSQQRHAAHRAVEPGLPAAYEQRGRRPRRDRGARHGRRLRRRRDPRRRRSSATCSARRAPTRRWGPNVWVEPAGHAVQRAGGRCATSTRLAAARWVEEGRTSHYAVVPAERCRARRRVVPARLRPAARPRDPGGAGDAAHRAARRASRSGGRRATTSTRWRSSSSLLPAHQQPRRASRRSAPPPLEEAIEPSGTRTSTTRPSRRSSPSSTGAWSARRSAARSRCRACTRGSSRPDDAAHLGFAAVLAGCARTRRRQRARHDGARLGGRRGLPRRRHRLARDEPALVAHLAEARLPADVLPALPRDRLTRVRRAGCWLDGGMARIPLLSGSRVPLVTVDDDALLLVPPAPLDPLRDMAAAVGEALRYPLSGPRARRSRHARRPRHDRRRAPLAAASRAPRSIRASEAVAAVIDELERLGMPAEQAHDPDRRRPRTPGRPPRARGGPPPHRRHATSAARSSSTTRRAPTCGPRARRRAARADPPRRCSTPISSSASRRPRRRSVAAPARSSAPARPRTIASVRAGSVAARAVALARRDILAGKVAAALARRTAVTGVSIVLDHPRLTGPLPRLSLARRRASTALARSPLRRLAQRASGAASRHVAAERSGAS